MSGAADPWAAAAAQYQQEQAQGQPQTQTSSQQKPEQGIVPYLSQVAGGLWQGAKSTAELLGKGVLATINPTPANQYDFAQTLVGPNVRQGMQAAQDVKQGNYGSAVTHGVGTVLPPVAGVIDKTRSGDYTGAVADATTLGIEALAGKYGMENAPAAVQGVGDWMGVDRDAALWKAVPLRISAEKYLDMAPTVRADIVQAGDSTGIPLDSVVNVKKAVAAAKDTNRQAFNQFIDPARQSGMQISGAPIADAINNSIPMSTRVEATTDPSAAQQIQNVQQLAQAYRRGFTVDQLRNLAMETNADLNAFYHKTADAQAASLASKGGVAALEAKAAAIRQIMQQTFGDGAADLQRRWGYLDDVDAGLSAAHKRYLTSEAPVSGPDSIFQRSGAVGKALHGDVEGAKYAARGGKTNSLLRDAFAKTEPSGPLPQPGPNPVGTPLPPNRQLPSPSIAPQPPADTSYVRSVPAQPMPLAPNRQLPAPSNPPATMPTLPEGFRVVRHAPAPGQPMPAQATSVRPTSESVAVSAGRAILDALRNNPPQ